MLSSRSRIRNKILNYFFLNEGRKTYINELARLLESDPKNVYRILLKLEEEDVLQSEFQGKERYYRVNTGTPFYKNYKNLFLKTVGIEAVLQKELKNIPGLLQAYIFGSYAQGKYTPASDIDLLLVGKHKSLEAEKLIYKIGKQTGREINAVNISPQELKRKKENKDQFVVNIFKNKMIQLI